MKFSNIHQNTYFEYLLVQLNKQIYNQIPKHLMKMTMEETGNENQGCFQHSCGLQSGWRQAAAREDGKILIARQGPDKGHKPGRDWTRVCSGTWRNSRFSTPDTENDLLKSK